MSQHEAVTPRGSSPPHRPPGGPALPGPGMALAYLGAFRRAVPHHLPVAVGGQERLDGRARGPGWPTPRATRSACAPSRPRPRRARSCRAGDLAAAYEPGPSTVVVRARPPERRRGRRRVRPGGRCERSAVAGRRRRPCGHRRQGQQLFFLLVVLSVGAYTAAVMLGVAGAAAGVRFRDAPCWCWCAGVIAGIGTLVAGRCSEPCTAPARAVRPGWLYVGGWWSSAARLHAFVGRWVSWCW